MNACIVMHEPRNTHGLSGCAIYAIVVTRQGGCVNVENEECALMTAYISRVSRFCATIDIFRFNIHCESHNLPPLRIGRVCVRDFGRSDERSHSWFRNSDLLVYIVYCSYKLLPLVFCIFRYLPRDTVFFFSFSDTAKVMLFE